jgi:hypothetical protein
LPTLPVLIQGLTNQFITTPATVSGFQSYYGGYWSSTPLASNSGLAWLAVDANGDVRSYNGDENYVTLVRCVR